MMTTQKRIEKLRDAEDLIRDVLADMGESNKAYQLVLNGANNVYRAHSQLKKASEKKAKKRPVKKPVNVSTNGHNQRTYPELIKPAMTEQEATYRAALELVARIDEDLTRGVRHYRTKAGQLLETLDQVVRAVLADNLLGPDEEEVEVIWMRPEGLAA